MKKGTRDRQHSKAATIDPKIWLFYQSLDKHVKRDFFFEINQRLGWTKSTFYRRLSEGYSWNKDEVRIVTMIYNNYKHYYGNGE